jgi:hypothetical protein
MNDFLPNLAPEEKLLLSLCRLEFSEEQKSEIRDLMNEINDWDHSVKLANEHGIIALSWYNITETDNSKYVPPEYLKTLRNAYLINITHNTYLYDQLAKILELIKDKDIKVVLLKGMALEKTIYGNQGLRQMTDIDVLVNPNVVLELRRIFMKNGFKSNPFKSPLYKYLIPYLNTHIPRLSKDDAHLEIHYKLFDQMDNSLTEKLLELSTPIKIGESNAFIPPPQLFFLYMISHLKHHTASGDSQLRQYTDLYLLLSSRFEEIINDQLIRYAAEVHMEIQLAGMLCLLHTFWEIDYPDWLNRFISQYDHLLESEKFCRFIKQPKDNPDKMVSSNYIKQIAVIPGFFRKALYVTGFIFPSLGFMKNRYKTKTRLGAALYYPVRWGRSVGLYLLSGLTARRREGMKVTKRLRD